ncbi:MAG: hypothetical protein ABI721_04660 [Candidatus Dojkabacteria bacterium]
MTKFDFGDYVEDVDKSELINPMDHIELEVQGYRELPDRTGRISGLVSTLLNSRHEIGLKPTVLNQRTLWVRYNPQGCYEVYITIIPNGRTKAEGFYFRIDKTALDLLEL